MEIAWVCFSCAAVEAHLQGSSWEIGNVRKQIGVNARWMNKIYQHQKIRPS